MRGRSRWVAATTRVSTVTGRSAPTGCTVCASSTRSSFACAASGSSPSSSRNSVPPLASTNAPLRSRSAPVNAPLDVAEQVRVDQRTRRSRCSRRRRAACAARGDASWIACAASSLPVPDSPSISTVASVGEAISSTANSSRIATTLPRHRAEVVASARRQARRVARGDPHRRVAELDGGTCGYHDLADPGALPPRAVGRAEILDPDPVGGDRELRMLSRHLRIAEHEITARVRSDGDRPRAERHRGRLLAHDLQVVSSGRGPPTGRGHRETGLDQRPPIECHDSKDTRKCCEVRAVIGSDRCGGVRCS